MAQFDQMHWTWRKEPSNINLINSKGKKMNKQEHLLDEINSCLSNHIKEFCDF